MADQDQANKAGEKSAPRSLVERVFAGTTTQSLVQTGGIIFVGVSAIAFIYAVITIIKSSPADRKVAAGADFWQDLISANFDIVAPVVIAIVAVLFALRLFSRAGSMTSEVIRLSDRDLLTPLIKEANKDAIGEYIRLASLSGFTGTFQYLGFTGLPLATVALTLILLAIALWVDDDELKKGVFDMAKLTLGAFLGSFVQRNLETEKLAGKGPGTGPDVTIKGGPDVTVKGGPTVTVEGGKGGAPDERLSIGTALEGLASQAQTVRNAVDQKKTTVDEEKQSQVEVISTSLDEIEEKIGAAQDSVRDKTVPIEKVRTAAKDATTAAAQLAGLTTSLQAI
jgi:hypothetical protein